jgi:hypothetical protein
VIEVSQDLPRDVVDDRVVSELGASPVSPGRIGSESRIALLSGVLGEMGS